MNVSKSKTLTVSINREPKSVYDFVSNGANLPRWAAAFCKSARPSKDGWLVETPQGPVTIRFCETNDLGVLDHRVTVSPGVEVSVPMRVVPNGSGSEVLFTLFRTPDMSDARFTEDLRMIQQDLNTLKRILES